MSQSQNVVGMTLWELGNFQEVVGLAGKVTWGQRLVSGGGSKPCFMRLWYVNAKPRGSSKPRGLSVNRWLGKAELGLALCGSGMLIVQPPNMGIS
jgi:hypothetical protein